MMIRSIRWGNAGQLYGYAKTEITFDGDFILKPLTFPVSIRFDYDPEECETRSYSGCKAEVTITQIEVAGMTDDLEYTIITQLDGVVANYINITDLENEILFAILEDLENDYEPELF